MRTVLELVKLVEQGELALERTRWTMTDGSTTSGSSTVLLERQTNGAWCMMIDDPRMTPSRRGSPGVLC